MYLICQYKTISTNIKTKQHILSGFYSKMDVFAEICTAESAMFVVNEFALSKKLNQFQLAMSIPGLVHNHVPTANNTEDCDYCKRAGNIYNESQEKTDTKDIISRYKKSILQLLKNMELEITEELVKCVS